MVLIFLPFLLFWVRCCFLLCFGWLVIGLEIRSNYSSLCGLAYRCIGTPLDNIFLQWNGSLVFFPALFLLCLFLFWWRITVKGEEDLVILNVKLSRKVLWLLMGGTLGCKKELIGCVKLQWVIFRAVSLSKHLESKMELKGCDWEVGNFKYKGSWCNSINMQNDNFSFSLMIHKSVNLINSIRIVIR